MSEIGAITGYMDVAQVVLYAFWIFFASLVFYLRREDRREGYPLENDPTGRAKDAGFLFIPPPKTFSLAGGETVSAPDFSRDGPVANAERTNPWPGAPLTPVGDPMLAGVGPGAHAQRANKPDLLHTGEPRIVPMKGDPEFSIEARDPDPRGKSVIGGDGASGGTVTDVWVDRGEHLIRYLEVDAKSVGGAGRVLLPMPFARVSKSRGAVLVNSIFGAQFANAPGTKSPNQVTLLEEEKIVAYYGAGTLYATPARTESLA